MFTLFLFFGVPITIIIVLIVRLARPRRVPNAITLGDVGLIMDGALRAFVRDGLPLVALSAVLVPLGLSTGNSLLVALPFLGVDRVARMGGGSNIGWTVVTWLGWLSVFGLGHTILGCGVAQAMRLRRDGRQVSLGRILATMQWRSAVGLALVLAVPSAIASVLGIIGSLLALTWSVAPFVLVDEGLRPYQAIKRSSQIVRPKFSGLLNTLVPLWIIGWLMVGTPLFMLIFALSQVLSISFATIELFTVLTTVVGNVVVPPLIALGVFQYYQYVLATNVAVRSEEEELQALVNQRFGSGEQHIAS